MGKVQIIEDTFGSMEDPITGKHETIQRFTFDNNNGISVQVITYGAAIISIRCPDKYGEIADIALGFDDLKGMREKKKTKYFLINSNVEFCFVITCCIDLQMGLLFPPGDE